MDYNLKFLVGICIFVLSFATVMTFVVTPYLNTVRGEWKCQEICGETYAGKFSGVILSFNDIVYKCEFSNVVTVGMGPEYVYDVDGFKEKVWTNQDYCEERG